MLTVRITTALMKTDSKMEPTMVVVMMVVVASRLVYASVLDILISLSAYIGCNA